MVIYGDNEEHKNKCYQVGHVSVCNSSLLKSSIDVGYTESNITIYLVIKINQTKSSLPDSVYKKGDNFIVSTVKALNFGSDIDKSKQIKLYHVSLVVTTDTLEFIPRVPASKSPSEDSTTPRICFSDSIEGCFRSIGDVVDKLGSTDYLVTIYEFVVDFDNPNLISWETLYNKGIVGDAEYTHEYWYTKPITLTGKRYEIMDFIEDYHYLVHENQKEDILDYLNDKYNLSNEKLKFLQSQSGWDILNNILYDIDIPGFDESQIQDIAEYFNCSYVVDLTDIKLKDVKV